jgi:hypothetical protein
MNSIQTFERLSLVCGDVDTWNADDEPMTNIRNRVERRKMFELRSVHSSGVPSLRHKT